MYLYVSTELLSHADSDESENRAEKALVSELAKSGEAARLESIDIGRGASADAFKVFLDWLPNLYLIALFFLGTPIEKNVDAWISLAKRLRDLVRQIQQRGHGTVVTFEGACAIALDEIVENGWHEPGFEIDHIVVSNQYAASHAGFESMEDSKAFIEQDRKDNFDPLSAAVMYTFFGRCETKLFIVTVDGGGRVVLAKQL